MHGADASQSFSASVVSALVVSEYIVWGAAPIPILLPHYRSLSLYFYNWHPTPLLGNSRSSSSEHREKFSTKTDTDKGGEQLSADVAAYVAGALVAVVPDPANVAQRLRGIDALVVGVFVTD